MPRPTRSSALTLTAILLVLPPLACDERAPGDNAGEPPDTTAFTGPAGSQRPDQADTPDAGDRPDARTDTIHLEGMPESIALRLFRTPDNFPLPFTAYVPEDMDASADAPGEPADSAGVRFVAEFGGVRNEEAYLHLFVFAAGTVRAQAVAHARAYQTASGVPVSRGIEPLPQPERAVVPWALEAYRFQHQGESGMVVGRIMVGQHDDRFFLLVRHYPAEYGDGFGPRAALVLETWRWADGTGLTAGQNETARPR